MPKVHSLQRRATHGGDELEAQVAGWLRVVPSLDVGGDGRTRGVIAPHAGYSYSGAIMAYAYKHINPDGIKRVFLLGPSHHFFSRQCHLSPCKTYESPIGNAVIDTEVYEQLKLTGKFPYMTREEDEDEHSLEMHIPYILKVMKGRPFGLVPIVVGALTNDAEAEYGGILAPYLRDPSNIFIISSDFCHWGSRFGFQFRREEDREIHESIAWLDRLGMDIIEKKDPTKFQAYLQKYGNTICGRHPIGVFLFALQHSGLEYDVSFTKYDRSSLVTSPWESSVSYASAVIALSSSSS